MGILDLNKEFESKNIIHFSSPAQKVFVDACIYWEWILPKETDYSEDERHKLPTDETFRKKICFNFFNYVFDKLLTCEISSNKSDPASAISVEIVFDNDTCRPWLKWSKCIQRRKHQISARQKKIRFHASMDELSNFWDQYVTENELAEKYAQSINVKFTEAPRDTDDYIYRQCEELIAQKFGTREVLVDDLMSTERRTINCAKISIFSSDSDFLSFFPFPDLVCVCHGETWNCEMQVTRLMNFACKPSPFWQCVNSKEPAFDLDFKLALYKVNVIARGHNDYMTCSFLPTRKDFNWDLFLNFISDFTLPDTENADLFIFFNYLYYLHLDINLNPLKFKQLVGNSIRLLVADPPNAESWSFMELAASSSSKDGESKIIYDIVELKDFLSNRIEIVQNVQHRKQIEQSFKDASKKFKNVNISNAMNEWFAYFETSYQNHIGKTSAKKRKIDQAKWNSYTELNLVFFKSLSLLYLSLFKIWFKIPTTSTNYPSVNMFLRRLYQLACLGNNVDLSTEIKDKEIFYMFLNDQ